MITSKVCYYWRGKENEVCVGNKATDAPNGVGFFVGVGVDLGDVFPVDLREALLAFYEGGGGSEPVDHEQAPDETPTEQAPDETPDKKRKKG